MNDNYNPPFDDMTESERTVADFLASNGMWWQYEYPIFLRDDKERPRVWAPDFYIPKLSIYVEVIGDNQKSYNYRRTIFEKNNVPIVFVYPNQSGWKEYLISQLIAIHQFRDELVTRIKNQ